MSVKSVYYKLKSTIYNGARISRGAPVPSTSNRELAPGQQLLGRASRRPTACKHLELEVNRGLQGFLLGHCDGRTLTIRGKDEAKAVRAP